jgi:MoaA/NifB/PqqE/SkfB family radical SAM enzyme
MCKIHAYQLIPEISRKCNIACRHCLRGPAQNKKMSEEVINRIFDIFDMSQTTITFGGGEPTLALDVIEEFINRLDGLDSFYIVSNGKVYHHKLVELCDRLYNMSSEPEICGLAFSSDMFHEEFVPYDKLTKNIQKYSYETIEEYGEYYEEEREYICIYDKKTDFSQVSLIEEGRAKDLSWGYKMRPLKEPYLELSEYQDEDIWIQEGEIYVSYNGNLYSSCDMSYHHMDKKDEYFIGNIFDEDITDKIYNYAKERMEK